MSGYYVYCKLYIYYVCIRIYIYSVYIYIYNYIYIYHTCTCTIAYLFVVFWGGVYVLCKDEAFLHLVLFFCPRSVGSATNSRVYQLYEAWAFGHVRSD